MKGNEMDMTIEEYLAFERHLLKQAEADGFTYDELPNEESD
jgi:hypothetical protein